MQEKGLVLRANKKKAIVEIKRRDECASCKACFFGNNDKTAITAVNTANASAGDEVLVKISDKKNTWGYLIVFGIPLVFLLLGTMIGGLLENDIFTIIGAFIGLFLGFVVIYIIDKLISRDKSRLTQVIEVLSKKE